MYPLAVEHGINPIEFWDMTPWEINKAVEGHQSRIKRELQTSAMIAYSEANTIALMVNRLLDKKTKVPTLQEAFPGIFDEIKEVEEPKFKQLDWRVMKARLEKYAMEKKAWEVSKRGNNNRGTASPNHSQDKRSTERDRKGQVNDARRSKGD